MFARSHRNKTPQAMAAGGLLRAARAGASHAEWIQIALEELAQETALDRVGIWLEPSPDAEDASGAVVFSGAVWERNGSNLPREWRKLSAEAPLPREVLTGKNSVEYELKGATVLPMLGPLVELQRALWVPVNGHHNLAGLILAGSREHNGPLPRAKVERIATELGLLLEIEEERRLARERQEDLTLWRRVQDLLQQPEVSESLLNELAESCAVEKGKSGAGAVFAMIAERKAGLPVNTPAAAGEADRLLLRAQTGDPAWTHSLEDGPLENLWRQAVDTGRVCGAEADRLPLARKISRIVAIPMEFDGGLNGVLLAGLPRRRGSLSVLVRLELRALLAAQVFERRNRSERASSEEAQKRALLESMEEPVVIMDPQGVIRGMSRGARQLTGDSTGMRGPAPALPRFAELFRPREWEDVHGWVLSGFSGGPRPPDGFFVAHARNGTALRLRLMDLSDPEYCAVSLEKTGQESHAREAQEDEAELPQVLDWLDEGVVVFDENNRIRARNARFLQILGLSADDAAQLHTLEELIRRTAKNASEPEKFMAQWKAFAEGAEEGMREELSMKGPVPQVIERYTRTIVARSGRRLGRVEVYREMSAQRMFQSRMVQTEKLVSMGQRVSGIVHELSNPLTTILVNAQRLRSRESDPARDTLAKNILEESERATNILRQLLDMSRESLPERRRVSLNEVVERTVELQRLALSGSHVRLIVEKQEGLPLIEGDFGQLQQVLMNLLQNAQQAIEQSGTGSAIGIRTALAGAGRVQLQVWDDGPGIPGAIQARIFDPFFTTKPPGLGTGLGLAIVLGFVRQHGGTVALTCPPHSGTRFTVELPVAPVAELQNDEESAELEPVERVPPTEAPALGTLLHAGAPRILVVEDEPTVAALISDLLREEGMRVDVLLDGRQALQQAERESYDLAICDMKMPGIDGQRFYQILVQRQNPLREHVLFVTGDILAPRTREFLERHQLQHVAKPFRMEELTTAVHSMLGKKKQIAAQEAAVRAKQA